VKPNIHPEYKEITVHCACGASWQTRSTSKELHLDICSNCHPFFTGRQKLIDTEAAVETLSPEFGARDRSRRARSPPRPSRTLKDQGRREKKSA
jgi:large subunit ribosomal protein L31